MDALLQIGLLVLTAKLAEGVFGRIGLGSIAAYTIAGALLGPVAGVVGTTGDIQLFLNVGIFLFFFIIGFDEIDLPGFIATIRGRYFAAATLSVAISVVISLSVTSDLFLSEPLTLGLDFNAALSIAGILSLSSLGVVAKVLADRGMLKELIGLRIFTAVIIAEAFALLLVGATISSLEHEMSVGAVVTSLGKTTVFVIATWFVSAKVLPRAIEILERVLKVSELSFGLLMSGLFLVVAGAEEVELHGSLGALLYGASLAGLPNRMRRKIIPGFRSAADGLFVPLFFAAVGLRLDLSFVSLPLETIAALVLIPSAGKFVGSLIGTYLVRMETPFVLTTGLMAKGVAEIALLLVLLDAGVIATDVFSLLVFVMFGYILLTPPAIGFAINRAKDLQHAVPPAVVPPSFARHALEGVTAHSVVDRTRIYPDPGLSVAGFVDDWVVPPQQDYLVVEDAAPVGVVSLPRLRRLAKGSRAATPLRDVVQRSYPQAFPDEPIDDVLKRMTDHSLGVIPVIERDTHRLVGSIASHDIIDLVVLMHEIQTEVERRAAEDQ